MRLGKHLGFRARKTPLAQSRAPDSTRCFASQPTERTGKPRRFGRFRSVSTACRPADRGFRLEEAVGVDVDGQAHRAGHLHPRAPGGQEALQVDGAVGADQEALASAPAHQAERRVGRAVDVDALGVGRGGGQGAGEGVERRPDRRRRRSAPPGGQRAAGRAASRSAISAATKASRSWPARACITAMVRRIGLQQRPARPVAARPARPATWASSWKVRSAARRSPPRRPRSASTTPDQGQVGEVVALGGGLGGHQDVDLAGGHRLDQRPGAPRRRPRCRTRRPPSGRPGKRSRASSSTRSTPGPIETRLSLAPQWGQRSGLGMEKPVRWQTSRPV